MIKRIVVQDGMYRAAMKFQDSGIQFSDALEAALLWLAENPIVPNCEQAEELFCNKSIISVCVEWQRRMFLAPEPEVPEELKDLLDGMKYMPTLEREWATRVALESYRLGQRSKA